MVKFRFLIFQPGLSGDDLSLRKVKLVKIIYHQGESIREAIICGSYFVNFIKVMLKLVSGNEKS